MRRFFGAASASLQAVLTASSNPTKVPKFQEFLTSGSFSVPTNVTWLSALVVGGGAGGHFANGGAGGMGGYVRRVVFSVTPGQNLTMTIGAGGVGGTGSTVPGSGGDSSIAIPGGATYTAPGGQGGPSNITTPISQSSLLSSAGAPVDAFGLMAGGMGGSGGGYNSSSSYNVFAPPMPGQKGIEGYAGGGGGAVTASNNTHLYTPGGPGADGGGVGQSKYLADLYGAGNIVLASSGRPNTGGGGGGSYGTYTAGNGGSGIIRLEWMQ